MDDFKDAAGLQYLLTAIDDVAVSNDFNKYLRQITLVFMTKTKHEAWDCMACIKRNIHPALWEVVKFYDRTVIVNNRLRICITSEEDQLETRTYKIEGR